MRRFLDKLFENKKLSFLIPTLASVLLYLLFVIFGTAEDKINLMISTPIGCIFWFLGVFLVIYVQVRNSRCPERFLNFCELLATVFFCGFSVVQAILFVVSGFRGFTPVMCAGLMTYASVSWAHNKRAK